MNTIAIIVLSWLLAAPPFAAAQEIQRGGQVDPIAAAATAPDDLLASLKAPKAGLALSYFDDQWHKEGVGYWTLAQFGDKGLRMGAAEAKPYIDFDFGLAGQSFKDVKIFLPLMLHPRNLVEPGLNKISPGGRLLVRDIPEWLELGPALRYCPDKSFNKQRIMEDLALLIAYKFGGPSS